jgi:hypothetical protein
MSSTSTILFIKHIGIPLFLELANRRELNGSTKGKIQRLIDDPERALEVIAMDRTEQKVVVTALADTVDHYLDDLLGSVLKILSTPSPGVKDYVPPST